MAADHTLTQLRNFLQLFGQRFCVQTTTEIECETSTMNTFRPFKNLINIFDLENMGLYRYPFFANGISE